MLQWLLRIRLSVLAFFFLVTFVIVIRFLHQQTLTPGQLALFSVNTFLFGYYFNPLLQSQKSRVASLNDATRNEAMTLLDILAQSHLLSRRERHTLKIKLRLYLHSIVGNYQVQADNEYYDELLHWTKETHSDNRLVLNGIYNRVQETQKHRDTLANQFATKIYSHEWLVAWVLFAITLYFALQTKFGDSVFFGLMLAVLCTGLCLLMAILMKFATLTHKEAKRMWEPLQELEQNHFDDVTNREMAEERMRIQAAAAVAD